MFLIFSSLIPVVEKGFAYKISNGILFIYIIVFALFGIFAFFTADWSSYKTVVEEQFRTNGQAATNVEQFWRWLSIAVKGNIYSFRAFIFISCYGILYLYLKLFVPKKNYFIFIFLYLLFMVYYIGGMRQGLAIILFYFAYTLLQRNIIFKILALMFIVAACFLHKATVLFLPILLFSCIRPSKKIIVLSIIVEVVVIFLLKYYSTNFTSLYFIDFYYLPENYGGSTSRRIIYIGKIANAATVIFYLMVLVKSFKCTLSVQGNNYRTFFYYGYLFYLILSFTNIFVAVSSRLEGMLLFPMIMLISEMMREKKRRSKIFTVSFWLYIFIFFINTNTKISAAVRLGAGLF
jgi:hypothetical protein